MFKGIFLSTEDFKHVMKDTEDDIKVNRVKFKKRTNIKEVVNIAVTCATTLKRCG
jgi:hypothetical protein